MVSFGARGRTSNSEVNEVTPSPECAGALCRASVAVQSVWNLHRYRLRRVWDAHSRFGNCSLPPTDSHSAQNDPIILLSNIFGRRAV